MRTFDLTPLYRSTVGFDRLFDILDDVGHFDPVANWPPYNIEKVGGDQYRIVMAVAGFAPDEIELVQQRDMLFINGQKHPDPEGVEILHRGLATRAFKQRFSLADYVKVTGAKVENGLLIIDLAREIPDAMKPRKIEIGQAGDGAKMIEHDEENPKAA